MGNCCGIRRSEDEFDRLRPHERTRLIGSSSTRSRANSDSSVEGDYYTGQTFGNGGDGSGQNGSGESKKKEQEIIARIIQSTAENLVDISATYHPISADKQQFDYSMSEDYENNEVIKQKLDSISTQLIRSSSASTSNKRHSCIPRMASPKSQEDAVNTEDLEEVEAIAKRISADVERFNSDGQNIVVQLS